MSQTAVSAAVLSRLSGITGIVSAVPGIGDANATLPGEFPMIMYSVGEPQEERLTYGTNGMIWLHYQVDIRVLLGTPEMLSADAEAVKLLIGDRVRAAFTADPTMGGACFWCEPSSGSSNLPTFRDIDDYPTLKYMLSVEEYTNASTPAA